jgi:hypothetical protein
MLFMHRGILEDHEVHEMLHWPHSGFHVHDSVFVPEGDTDFALRLARYCARNPVALERMEYGAKSGRVIYRSDKSEGPTARTELLDPLEFLARGDDRSRLARGGREVPARRRGRRDDDHGAPQARPVAPGKPRGGGCATGFRCANISQSLSFEAR